MSTDETEPLSPELAELEKLIERRDAGAKPPRPPAVSDEELLAEIENGSEELDELREQYESHPTKGVKPNGVRG